MSVVKKEIESQMLKAHDLEANASDIGHIYIAIKERL